MGNFEMRTPVSKNGQWRVAFSKKHALTGTVGIFGGSMPGCNGKWLFFILICGFRMNPSDHPAKAC